ncbi:hypothetical protein BcepSauron_361 [Burkholderia phage BcepSauron]|uniref:Uncharacterized protein n=2 Tax=Sarumanvirus TaxID=2843450 RepID=A0A482ML11_9CAUD|nr:hypothetical protein H1O16_gp358 [Burkholderia phage BcepSaruman]YP_009904739.1 hypothetical protein H1O17_gp361 [Burkholderia phage BcepSauron]QBQ74741.1 hypothetical protein BcepSauron_361 [Burkholderia phage BcepSauron]QBX06771.1 hypothetical protein BcepSaruman_358 [Burkholderia phage BcepSaruman]
MNVNDALKEVMHEIQHMPVEELRALHEASKNGPWAEVFRALYRDAVDIEAPEESAVPSMACVGRKIKGEVVWYTRPKRGYLYQVADPCFKIEGPTFEDWARDHGYELSTDVEGDYESQRTRAAFEGWKAAKAGG